MQQLRRSDCISESKVKRRVILLLTKSDSCNKLIVNFTQLALLMSLSGTQLGLSDTLRNGPVSDVLLKLLTDWLAVEGVNATVGKLQDIFKEANLKHFSDILEDEIIHQDEDDPPDNQPFVTKQTEGTQGQGRRKAKNKKTLILVLLIFCLVAVILSSFMYNYWYKNVRKNHSIIYVNAQNISNGTVEHFKSSVPISIVNNESTYITVSTSSFVEYTSKDLNCANFYIINLSSTYSNDWPVHFSPICPNQTKELILNGEWDADVFVKLLVGLPALETFTAESNSNIANLTDNLGVPRKLLNSLRKLHLRCKTCFSLYKFMTNFVALDQVRSAELLNILIDDENYNAVQTFVTNLTQVTRLEIVGNVETTHNFLPEIPLTKLVSINISLNVTANEGELTLLYQDFCDSFPNLKSLKSDSWPFSFNALKTCRYLEFVELEVNDNENGRYRDLKVFHLYMRHLKTLQLRIVYGNDNGCPSFNVKGIRELECKASPSLVNIQSVNCPILRCPQLSYKFMKYASNIDSNNCLKTRKQNYVC